MKKLSLSLLFVCAMSSFFAQKIYSVDADYKANVKVFVVDADYKADYLSIRSVLTTKLGVTTANGFLQMQIIKQVKKYFLSMPTIKQM